MIIAAIEPGRLYRRCSTVRASPDVIEPVAAGLRRNLMNSAIDQPRERAHLETTLRTDPSFNSPGCHPIQEGLTAAGSRITSLPVFSPL